MSYTVLARKYRPQKFADLVGQEATARTLQNAIRSNRVAHAYLFVGPRGLGKTTTARLLARAVNCAEGPAPEPCGTCDSCLEIARGTCLDVIEIDAASNRGIDEIRDLRERVHLSPASCRRKVYIVDEVHMLTNEAFNALLKTLEEPPAHVLFVLATTEPQKVPETVRSRCQRFDFRPIAAAKIVARLGEVAALESLRAPAAALEAIARAAGGGMRDAFSLLDQAATLGGGEATVEAVAEVVGGVPEALAARVAEAVERRDLAAALEGLATVEASGYDLSSLGTALLDRFRAHLRRDARGDAAAVGGRRLVDSIGLLVEALDRARRSAHPAAFWEAALARLCLLAEEEERIEAVAERLEAMERRLLGGDAPPASSALPAPRAAAARARGITAPPRALASSSTAPVAAAAPTAPAAPHAPPAPIAGAAMTAPADGAPLPRIERSWEEIVDRVRAARGPRLAAFLKESRPAVLDGDALVIEFRFPFHRDGFAADPQGLTALSDAVSGLVGRPVAIETRLVAGAERAAAASAAEAEAAPAARAAARRPEDEPLVAAALEIFGGEVVGSDS